MRGTWSPPAKPQSRATHDRFEDLDGEAARLSGSVQLAVVVVARTHATVSLDYSFAISSSSCTCTNGADRRALARTVRQRANAAIDAPYGSGLSFRDPDNIALEFFAPPG